MAPPPPPTVLVVSSLALVPFVLAPRCFSRASRDVPKNARVPVRVRVKAVLLAVVLEGGDGGVIFVAFELLSLLLLLLL